jgi:Leucine-rich repeat (LRR) protein
MKTLLSFFLLITLSNIVVAQTTAIPDPIFESILISRGYDSGTPDGLVLTSSIDTITQLTVQGGAAGVGTTIADLTGIEDFIALESLNCHSNHLTTLDLSQNTALLSLNCYNNQLTSLEVSQNTSLNWLACYSNQLTILDVSQNTTLGYLRCNNNQLTTLNLNQNIDLWSLLCSNNQLTILDVSQNSTLSNFICNNNQLTVLDVSQNTSLSTLYCDNNLLTTLDVSQNTALESFWCHNNQLTCLNMKNGNNHNIFADFGIGFVSNFSANNNSNLTCIEVDDVAYATISWSLIDAQSSFSTSCPTPCAVGIKENNLSNLSLYPNPTTGKFTIDFGEIKTDINATLTNSLGQVILFLQFESTDFINLNIESPTGIYFLKLESDGEVITKKIIKE